MFNLLLIDDEIEMLVGIEKILNSRVEFDVTSVSDFHKAVELIKTKKFDLVITDLKMNEHSGIDILKQSLEHNPESKVIMISGYGTIEASVEAIQLGAFDFIEKPFTSKKLFQCIDKALESISEKKSISAEVDTAIETEGIIYKSA